MQQTFDERNRDLVVSINGDGGFLFTSSELATAVQAGCRKLVTIVFNDATMAMIEVKQRRRQLPPLEGASPGRPPPSKRRSTRRRSTPARTRTRRWTCTWRCGPSWSAIRS